MFSCSKKNYCIKKDKSQHFKESAMIPKVFHQIWINQDDPELPPKFRAYRDGWLALHPDWEYKLWSLDNLDFIPRRMDLINSASNYAQMADILRYEILLRHGGIYLDTDFECLRNIDPILIGVKNFSCSEDGLTISIGIIGAEPNSIYMERCVNALPDRVGENSTPVETGPYMFTRVLLQNGLAADFTLFPREWFYPYKWNELHRANEHFPQSYAVHRYAGSWGSDESKFTRRISRKIKRMLDFLGAA
jgi:inositol phosphorylceramide mannosyltransferase catalytic subunit